MNVVLLISAVLTTLAETKNGAPSGHIYAALMASGCSFMQYTNALQSMIDHGWVNRGDNHWLMLTDAGRKKAAEIEEAIKKAKAERAAAKEVSK